MTEIILVILVGLQLIVLFLIYQKLEYISAALVAMGEHIIKIEADVYEINRNV